MVSGHNNKKTYWLNYVTLSSPCSLVLASVFNQHPETVNAQSHIWHVWTLSAQCLHSLMLHRTVTDLILCEVNHLCSILLRKYICSSCNIEQSSRQQMQMQSYRLVWEGKLIHVRGKKAECIAQTQMQSY